MSFIKKSHFLNQKHSSFSMSICEPDQCKKNIIQLWMLAKISHWTFFFQGWMNKIQDYDPETYHPSLTHSVFATLEGSCLRLDYPRTNIGRRATYDEKILDACFVKSHCFQLAKSKVRWEWGKRNCFKWIYALHEAPCLTLWQNGKEDVIWILKKMQKKTMRIMTPKRTHFSFLDQ